MGQHMDNIDGGSIWQAIGSIILLTIGMVTLNQVVVILAGIASLTTIALNIKKFFDKK